jgi:acetoin utilization deacetylase AcuC-like enzyme
VLYQAGADPHVKDPLGGWLTTEQLRARDAQVFESLASARIPLVWNLAGGYQRDRSGGIGPVLAIHENTAREHLRVFCAAPGQNSSS